MSEWDLAGLQVPGYRDVCLEIVQYATASFALSGLRNNCIAAPLGAVVHGPVTTPPNHFGFLLTREH